MDEYIALSALQHVAYCPRQFALIHLEQAWAENFFTAHGHILHERVDTGAPEQRGNVRHERSVSVQSEQLGISGKLDLLEIEGKPNTPQTRYFPVEYKRGKAKVLDWDRIQLCAQALCLEEMRGVAVTEGALWYWQERKREAVLFDEKLRQTTFAAIDLARSILTSKQTPPPTQDKKRCKACSLIDICAPNALRTDRSADYIAQLFNPHSEP